MNNIERRAQIIKILTNSSTPVSGSRLASILSVSRQVIVQDVALLRTEYPIFATAQGYLLYIPSTKLCRRTYLVRHTADEVSDELMTIVNAGGHVLDVIVEHDVYGQIRADLNLQNAEDVSRFCTLLKNSSSEPLFPISDGIHMHTVEAGTEMCLNEIEHKLREKGWLL